MCSRIEEIEEDIDSNTSKVLLKNCKKCGGKGSVLLRKKDLYCDTCFVINTNHKFRASLGKTKILKPNQNILLGLSGGLSSATLLHFVHNAINLEIHKKLRVNPTCVHIMGSLDECQNKQDEIKTAEKIIEMCKRCNIKVYTIPLSLYIVQRDFELPFYNEIPDIDGSNEEVLKKLGSNITLTGKNDLVAKIKRNMLIKVAEKLKCDTIFTAETTTKLATKTLSNLALGRGSQIEHDMGFCDSRHETVRIIRPMKDISEEELNYYSNINKITPAYYNKVLGMSLQSTIETFFTDLQQNYQATISTVCKTGEKLGAHNKVTNDQICKMCQSILDTRCDKSSALQATEFSRMVSSVHPRDFDTVANSVTNIDLLHSQDDDFRKNLCYGCRLTFSELKDCELHQYILHQ